MPIVAWWVLGAFGVGTVSGFALSSGTKKLVVYGGLGFLAYQMVKNKVPN